MTDDLKVLWESLKAEGASPAVDPERVKSIDAVMKHVFALQKAFERERDYQSFTSKAKCPICGMGTVIYSYRGPLLGSMKCDTPECIALNL